MGTIDNIVYLASDFLYHDKFHVADNKRKYRLAGAIEFAKERSTQLSEIEKHRVNSNIADLFIEDNKAGIKDSEFKKLQYETRNQGPLALAKRVEESARAHNWKKIKKEFGLKETLLGGIHDPENGSYYGGVQIYLPDVGEEEFKELKTRVSNSTDELFEDPFAYHEFYKLLEEEIEDIVATSDVEITDITTRFLDTHRAIATIMFDSEMKDRVVNEEILSDIYMLEFLRDQETPEIEYAIRMQIKNNPELGRKLDELHNQCILDSLTIYQQQGILTPSHVYLANKRTEIQPGSLTVN